MNIYSIQATILLFLLGSNAGAIADPDSTTLAPMIVTATRTAQTTDETLASVTIITREDIERQQAQSVQDVLRGVPGVGISNNGGPGKVTSLFLRGAESDHVLVLIDGIKVGSATLGTTAFQHIPIAQIERIEIVRGPRSSLYGSEAIGGVIQIFTRKGGGALRPFFAIGSSRYDTYTASGGISGGGERGWFSLNASAITTEGFNACDGKPSPGGAGCFTTEPDKDGYWNGSASLRAGYHFDNDLEVDAHFLRAEGKSDFDGGFTNETDIVQQIFGVAIDYALTEAWQLHLSAGRSKDESENFKDGTFRSNFETELDTFSIQGDFSLTDDQLISLGFDYQDDKVRGSTDYEVTSRNNQGLFAQYQATISAHDLQLSVRQDDNEQFGTHSTGGVSWGYTFGHRVRITASYGSAFKAPTFNELFFPGFGNPNLDPEKSRSVELGLSQDLSWGRWSLNAYETQIDDLISFDASTFAPANISEARILGVEAVVAARFKSWDLNMNLSWLDPENRANDANSGNVLPRRAEYTLRFDVDHQFGKISFGSTVYVEGRRYDDLANTRKLGGYTTVDVRTAYAFGKAWKVQARLDNLLDKDYETAAFFNQAGRSLLVTLRYQP